jgi:hypothetical protein
LGKAKLKKLDLSATTPAATVHVDRLSLDASGVPIALTAIEREVWRVVVETLPTKKRTPDRLPVLIAYCRAAARLDAAEAELASIKSDDVIHGGYRTQRAEQALLIMLRAARAAGVTAQDQPRKRGRPPKAKP